MASRKWAITSPGANLCSTVRPPTTTSASRPDDQADGQPRQIAPPGRSSQRGQQRSERGEGHRGVDQAVPELDPGVELQGRHDARAGAGRPVGAPSPEPVRRTAAPEKMVSASAHTAMAATTRKARGGHPPGTPGAPARPGNRFSGARLGEAGSIGPYRRTAGAAVPPDVGGAALCWDCRCCRSVMGRCLSRPPRQPRPARGRSQWGGVWLVSSRSTKPRIIELLLVTTLPTMVVASRGLPRLESRFWPLWSEAPWRPAGPTPPTWSSTATSMR